MTAVNLTKSLTESIQAELEELVAKGRAPKNRKELNRSAIRAVQRFLEGQRMTIRAIAERLVDQAEGETNAKVIPFRVQLHAELKGIQDEANEKQKAAEERFRVSVQPFRDALQAEKESIYKDVGARMMEANHIEKMMIKTIKTETKKEP